MRVLVTGGSGFIGSHVVDELLAQGHEVTIYDLAAPRHGQDCAFLRQTALREGDGALRGLVPGQPGEGRHAMKHQPPIIAGRTSIRDAIRAIERSGPELDEALIISDDGAFAGGVRSTDLRRLLISGASETEEVGAYPPKYTISIPQTDPRDERRLEGIVADLRLSGVRHVP